MKPQEAKSLLHGAIQDLTDCKWFFSRSPEADFSRKRKLSFELIVQAILFNAMYDLVQHIYVDALLQK